jgi:hypothetical protein
MPGRLKLRKKDGELTEQFDEWSDGGEELWEWIHEKIPPAPEGQLCEGEHDDEEFRPLATGYSWRIREGHVCYSYICEGCESRLSEDGPEPEEYPTTETGYAMAPQHCSS